MESKRALFTKNYRARLHTFLRGESKLNLARSLGRDALAARMEMLEVARIHEKAVTIETQSNSTGLTPARLIQRAGLFFAEVITPIEAEHRGAREAALRLAKLNQSLDKRTRELASSNKELKAEIRRRAGIESALKESERHYSTLLEESQLLQEQLRYVSRQILSAQEEERKRISRELHDQIAASLMGINIQLNALKSETTDTNRSLRRKIGRTQRLVQNSVEVIHAFARDLRPAALDDLGLIPALHSFAKAFSKQTGIRVRLKVIAGVEELNNPKRTVLYRVTQEAMTNVLKHAKASKVDVNIVRRNGLISLCVHDDGKSFLVERKLYSPGSKRLGLLGMRERVEMVGGNFRVQSEPGQGTSVQATIPIADSSPHANPARKQKRRK